MIIIIYYTYLFFPRRVLAIFVKVQLRPEKDDAQMNEQLYYGKGNE